MTKGNKKTEKEKLLAEIERLKNELRKRKKFKKPVLGPELILNLQKK